MAETQLHHPWGISELNLYPPEPGSSFRAWDAADELILDHLHSEQENPGNPILLINDSLGTLNCALKRSYAITLLSLIQFGLN